MLIKAQFKKKKFALAFHIHPSLCFRAEVKRVPIAIHSTAEVSFKSTVPLFQRGHLFPFGQGRELCQPHFFFTYLHKAVPVLRVALMLALTLFPHSPERDNPRSSVHLGHSLSC